MVWDALVSDAYSPRRSPTPVCASEVKMFLNGIHVPGILSLKTGPLPRVLPSYPRGVVPLPSSVRGGGE